MSVAGGVEALRSAFAEGEDYFTDKDALMETCLRGWVTSLVAHVASEVAHQATPHPNPHYAADKAAKGGEAAEDRLGAAPMVSERDSTLVTS